MVWVSGTLYAPTQTGTDETRKPITTLAATGTANFRPLPSRPSYQAIEGNGLDRTTRTMFTVSNIGAATHVEIAGKRYTVDHVANLGWGFAVTMWEAK